MAIFPDWNSTSSPFSDMVSSEGITPARIQLSSISMASTVFRSSQPNFFLSSEIM